jgi:sec-independent protein translocase protein TatB
VFDIGFFELLVIAVVGLVVIGPERLPGAIRSGALWWGRLKRSMRETRTELEKQLGADDIRRELHNEEVMRSLDALRVTREDLQRRTENDDKIDSNTEAPSERDTDLEATLSPPSSDKIDGNNHE